VLLVDRAGCQNEERFQVAVSAVTLYCGNIAYKLGLLKFNMKALTPWVINQLKSMRLVKKEVVSDSISVLGGFLGRFAANGIVVGAANATQSYNEPHGQIVYRYEIETSRCYIARDFLRNELTRSHTDFSKLRADLKANGVLINPDKRKTLTSGIDKFIGSQQLCWELDMSVPIVGNVAARMCKTPPSAVHLKSVGLQ